MGWKKQVKMSTIQEEGEQGVAKGKFVEVTPNQLVCKIKYVLLF